MKVRSENTPMGRVLLLTFRNLHLVAFVVRILGQRERSSILKKLESSSSSSITKRTAFLPEVFLDGIAVHLAEVAEHISARLS